MSEPLQPRFNDSSLAKQELSDEDRWAIGLIENSNDAFRSVQPSEYPSGYTVALTKLVTSGLIEAKIPCRVECDLGNLQWLFRVSGNWSDQGRNFLDQERKFRQWARGRTTIGDYTEILLTPWGEQAKDAIGSGCAGVVAHWLNLPPDWIDARVVFRILEESDTQVGGAVAAAQATASPIINVEPQITVAPVVNVSAPSPRDPIAETESAKTPEPLTDLERDTYYAWSAGKKHIEIEEETPSPTIKRIYQLLRTSFESNTLNVIDGVPRGWRPPNTYDAFKKVRRAAEKKMRAHLE